ncbi:hypothetical protein BLA39750_05026 [Burkholderia lata]|uniref:DUF5343 domain-containing protein n=1 Tax=Burkholderia lata (strain ATCC 17760 / DSM 23089 / LMG 22485 / NCIMB 9086 / R18194 / 383) TaxID=482957 RepID=A0A6P2ZMK0_BURL3|nr:DUF5343 domain-containing protein [Burkholderia lata]VWD36191.1 hypothetical protein BLA39750_05026 [Burkholderia lata]
MADKHPYMSGSAGLTKLTTQLRRTFPATVTADTLKKLEIAPNNETYVLNILKFIGVLDAENKKTAVATPIFNQHNDSDFQEQFSKLVRQAYHELFDLHGPDAWGLPTDRLIAFFRNHDGTSDIVGKRQASTFQGLARISGKAVDESEPAKSSGSGHAKATKKVAPAKKVTTVAEKTAAPSHTPAGAHTSAPPPALNGGAVNTGNVGLTVRIEINLPPGGDQDTYDAIFKSIRTHLLNGHDNGV